jgi:hypothetical protein
MTLKRTLWFPIAVALSGLNLVAVGFAAGDPPWHPLAHAVLALGFGLWAQRLRVGRPGSAALTPNEQLERQAAALADQSTQLAELQERVDFAERMLAQTRDRSSLGPREKRE